MGLDGRDGRNLACERCGRAVATRVDDCALWQAVRLEPSAVRDVSTTAAPRELTWDDVLAEPPDAPQIDQRGYWNEEWSAAAGAALAHLLVASSGSPVTVPDGPVAAVFRRSIDALLPPGPDARILDLAGPHLPAPDADIVLVPTHPQSGQAWRPEDDAAAVPLPSGSWAELAFHHDRSPLPVVGGLPEGVHRDDPPPLLPDRRFQPDRRLFLHVLARTPEVREPWLVEIYPRVDAFKGYPGVF